MKKYKAIVAIMAVMIVSFIFGLMINTVEATVKEKGTSMYMWKVESIDYSKYDKVVDYLNINKIYAYIGTAKLDEKFNSNVEELFKYAQKKNISIYIVYDENYDNQEDNATNIKKLIDEVNTHNTNSSYKIAGIAIDSEFYTLDSYRALNDEQKVQRFKDYVSAMKTSYEYAKQYGIKYVPCIPVWLEKLDINSLEELIKDGCDYVQIMNYNKNNMIENIRNEVDFSKKYNKPVENIAEFMKPGTHDVTDNITFYNDGIEACNNKFKEIDDAFNYNLLTFSYHHYTPLMEVAEKTIDFSEKKETVAEEPKTNVENTNAIGYNTVENEKVKDNNYVDLKQIVNNVKKDNTVVPGILPKTGENIFVIMIIAIGLIVFSIRILRRK